MFLIYLLILKVVYRSQVKPNICPYVAKLGKVPYKLVSEAVCIRRVVRIRSVPIVVSRQRTVRRLRVDSLVRDAPIMF